jgi:hypothetical protein
MMKKGKRNWMIVVPFEGVEVNRDNFGELGILENFHKPS